MRKTTVVITKAIVVQMEDDSYGRVDRWSRTYRTATHAAKCWAEAKIAEWEENNYRGPNGESPYHRMKEADYELRDIREAKLYRRALPIFRAMLA